MNTRRVLLTLTAALVLPVLAMAQGQSKTKTTAPGETLKVKLNYTGSGVVDEKHKIYVLVCDADPFSAERLEDYTGQPTPKVEAASGGQGQRVARILQRQGATTKDGTLTFSKLTISPVYAVVFYDKSGSYDGHADPSPGSPMGLYGNKASQPEPIKLESGKPTKVVVSFDDSTKTP